MTGLTTKQSTPAIDEDVLLGSRPAVPFSVTLPITVCAACGVHAEDDDKSTEAGGSVVKSMPLRAQNHENTSEIGVCRLCMLFYSYGVTDVQ